MNIFLAMLAGGVIVVTRTFNAKLGERIGVYQSTFFNYFLGFCVSLIVLIFMKEKSAVLQLPHNVGNILLFCGGLVGVCNIVLLNIITPKISALNLTLLTFVSQQMMGTVLDYFIYQQFSVQKVIGSIFVFGGLSYNMWLDNKKVGEAVPSNQSEC